MSVGTRLGTSTTQDLLLLGALGLAAYVAYTVVQGAKSVTKPFVDAGKAVAQMSDQASEVFDGMPDPTSTTWQSWYDPTQRSVFFYWLTFPDGNHHFVSGGSVLPDGSFLKDAIEYRLGTDKSGGLRAYAMPFGTTQAGTEAGLTNPTGGWS